MFVLSFQGAASVLDLWQILQVYTALSLYLSPGKDRYNPAEKEGFANFYNGLRLRGECNSGMSASANPNRPSRSNFRAANLDSVPKLLYLTTTDVFVQYDGF